MVVGRSARAATVVLIRAPRPSPVATEATVRLRGELVSAGFDVRVIDSPLEVDVRASLEEAAAAPGVEAVVAILGGSSGRGDPVRDSAELWVVDRVTGKTVVRRVDYQSGAPRGAEVLSIRALELLRASFLEVALAGRGVRNVPEPPPPEVTRWTDAALTDAIQSRWPSTWAVEVGGCVLGSLEGMTPSLMPLARVQRTFSDHLLGRVTVAGLGTPSNLTHQLTPTDVVHAEVTQQFGLVEGASRWRTNHIVQPFVSAGAGLLHIAAAGQARFPYEGIGNDRWALVADLGAGLHLSFRGRFALNLEAHAQGARPYPVIRFFGEEVAREGRPTLVGSLTVMVWL